MEKRERGKRGKIEKRDIVAMVLLPHLLADNDLWVFHIVGISFLRNSVGRFGYVYIRLKFVKN
jgi:hypothetical protein